MKELDKQISLLEKVSGKKVILKEYEVYVDEDGYGTDDEGNRFFVGKNKSGDTLGLKDMRGSYNNSRPSYSKPQSSYVERFTSKQLADKVGTVGAVINKQLVAAGFMNYSEGKWNLTSEGSSAGGKEMTGKFGKFLVWPASIIDKAQLKKESIKEGEERQMSNNAEYGELFEIGGNRWSAIYVSLGTGHGRTLRKVVCINYDEIDKAISTDGKEGFAELTMRPGGGVYIVGNMKTQEPAKFEQLVQAYKNKNNRVVEKQNKNSERITWNDQKHSYAVNLDNGKQANVGDTVLVRFSNGNFRGQIKMIGGRQDSEVTIVFPGRTKGRGIPPDRILDVM